MNHISEILIKGLVVLKVAYIGFGAWGGGWGGGGQGLPSDTVMRGKGSLGIQWTLYMTCYDILSLRLLFFSRCCRGGRGGGAAPLPTPSYIRYCILIQ